MKYTDSEFNSIIDKITQETGLFPLESHKTGIRNYLLKLEHFDINNKSDFNNLINESTVNETYFFREEKQFKLLENKLFPQWINNNRNKTAKIWSAACSSGEEIFSLLLLARKMNLNADFTASDLNTNRLETITNGKYRTRSIRTIDGSSFHYLLEPYKQSDGTVIFDKELCSKIKALKINLLELNYPVNQDFIFLRNVLLYFDKKLKKQILKEITEKAMASDGYLFVSINEIPSIDSVIIPDCLEKVFIDGVYCFHKKGGLS